MRFHLLYSIYYFFISISICSFLSSSFSSSLVTTPHLKTQILLFSTSSLFLTSPSLFLPSPSLSLSLSLSPSLSLSLSLSPSLFILQFLTSRLIATRNLIHNSLFIIRLDYYAFLVLSYAQLRLIILKSSSNIHGYLKNCSHFFYDLKHDFNQLYLCSNYNFHFIKHLSFQMQTICLLGESSQKNYYLSLIFAEMMIDLMLYCHMNLIQSQSQSPIQNPKQIHKRSQKQSPTRFQSQTLSLSQGLHVNNQMNYFLDSQNYVCFDLNCYYYSHFLPHDFVHDNSMKLQKLFNQYLKVRQRQLFQKQLALSDEEQSFSEKLSVSGFLAFPILFYLSLIDHQKEQHVSSNNPFPNYSTL